MNARLDFQRREFLRGEFRTLSLIGAVQHVKLYADGTSDAQRSLVRIAIRKHLETVSRQYADLQVSEKTHVDNVVAFAREISGRFPRAFIYGGFRIGPAQKALNLYLKYLWCAGLGQRPPHCPVDSIVLAEAGNTSIRWSQLASVENYREAIDVLRAAATKAGFASLADWELEAWRNGKANTAHVASRGIPSCHAFAAPHIP